MEAPLRVLGSVGAMEIPVLFRSIKLPSESSVEIEKGWYSLVLGGFFTLSIVNLSVVGETDPELNPVVNSYRVSCAGAFEVTCGKSFNLGTGVFCKSHVINHYS